MAKLTDFRGMPHSGIVPTAVVGIVTDNVDPEKLARIKVKFPTLHEEPVSYWLRVASPNAGKERGFYSLPEKDDEVLVLFMQGSQDVGLIIGQFWNGKDKPPIEAEKDMPKPADTDTGSGLSKGKFTAGTTTLDKNDRRFWRSRSGHLFVMDDSSGKESVTIWDKTHTLSLAFDTSTKVITLANTNSDGDIHIRAGQHIWIDAGKDLKFKAGNNWEGESVKDTKFTVGMNFEVDVTMNATIKATMNMDLKATMALTAVANMTATVEGKISFTGKGAMAELNGSGMATVKGGMVMIN
jgi:uncharacterized protein involved in type VI secretion and phage assembly